MRIEDSNGNMNTRTATLLLCAAAANAAAPSGRALLWPLPRSMGPVGSTYSALVITQSLVLVELAYRSCTASTRIARWQLHCLAAADRLTDFVGVGTGTLDAATFQFRSTGKNSSTLASAFERYAKLLAGERSNEGALAGRVLAGLNVDVVSESLSLGISTSEAYNLTIAFPWATLAADTVYGALRGIETFTQLLNADHTIVEQTVSDYPRFPHRGIMLDTSRHFLPVSFIASFLDAMSYSKLNVLHLHLTDSQSFPIESTTFPKLTDAAFKLSNGCRSLENPMPNESHVWHGNVPKGWHRQQQEPLTNCTCTCFPRFTPYLRVPT